VQPFSWIISKGSQSRTQTIKERAAQIEQPFLAILKGTLLDDLDNSARMGIDQNRSIVDHRIAIIADPILWRNVIIGHACFRQNCSNPGIPFIAV
jgi:hypothetical protein